MPGTCPNRDGVLGEGGCIFCDEEGSGFACLPNTMAIEEQITKNRAFFSSRFNAKKFIVYFQAYTNTYWDIETFKSFMETAAQCDDIVGISVSTRPDCMNDDYLQVLQGIRSCYGVDIDVELGLQTVNYRTLDKINRGHSLAEFIDALLRVKEKNFSSCIHLILNLPWDDMDDVVESAKMMSALAVQQVKLHSLYVVSGTKLGDMYQRGEFAVIPLSEYVDRAVTFLEYLSPHIVVQRLVGKGPQDKVLFNNWDRSWWYVKDQIEQTLIDRGTWQGKQCTYLNGKALKKIFNNN